MQETTPCPAACVLDSWVAYDWSQGLQLDSVRDMTEIAMETQNSLYEITVIDAASRDILIRGGKFFPERTPAHLSGSTFGGSFLKIGGIYAGLRMEILANGLTIVTSTVQSIRIAASR